MTLSNGDNTNLNFPGPNTGSSFESETFISELTLAIEMLLLLKNIGTYWVTVVVVLVELVVELPVKLAKAFAKGGSMNSLVASKSFLMILL
jgi:hypothetical protein